jgi:succinate dehydrogenase/fumarate reductase flavoprotein subunit
MKPPKLIALENVKRLMERDGLKPAQVARDFGLTTQRISSMLKNKSGLTDEAAKRFIDKYHWDKSEIYRGIEDLGKAKDANELLYELITQLDIEDKKTVARLIIRLLNKPKVALIMTQKIIQYIHDSHQ